MATQGKLTCVSCDTAFEPEPNGGFCPDCDTPHPEYERRDTVDADEAGADDEQVESEASEQVGTDEPDGDGADAGTAGGEADPDDADAEAPGEEDDAGAVEADDAGIETADEGDDADADAEPDDGSAAVVACPSCGSDADASASFCSNCGTELDADADADEAASGDLSACPDCGTSVGDESFCPSCGTDLDAVRDAADDPDDGDDAGGEADEADEADDEPVVPESVVLVVAGESFELRDGDTFGRQDEGWLDALVTACGGRDEVSYVSGEHLRVEVDDDGAYVTDLSTNGTALDGEELDGGRAKLADGSTLELAGRAEVGVEL